MHFNEDRIIIPSRLPAKPPIRRKQSKNVQAVYNVRISSPERLDIKDVVNASRELEDLHRTAFKRYQLPKFTKRLQSLTLPRVDYSTFSNSLMTDITKKPRTVNVVNASLELPPTSVSPTKRPLRIRKRSSTNLFWEGPWGDHLTYHTEYDSLQVDIEDESSNVPKFMKISNKCNDKAGLLPVGEMYSQMDKTVSPMTAGAQPVLKVNYLPKKNYKVRTRSNPVTTVHASRFKQRYLDPWGFSPTSAGVFKMNFSVDS